MKDYRLSEIKELCQSKNNCEDCELSRICDVLCFEKYPTEWNGIEPRDMIELPYKNVYIGISGQKKFQVLYRSEFGSIEGRMYNAKEEKEADAFLAKLKGEEHE